MKDSFKYSITRGKLFKGGFIYLLVSLWRIMSLNINFVLITSLFSSNHDLLCCTRLKFWDIPLSYVSYVCQSMSSLINFHNFGGLFLNDQLSSPTTQYFKEYSNLIFWSFFPIILRANYIISGVRYSFQISFSKQQFLTLLSAF